MNPWIDQSMDPWIHPSIIDRSTD